MVQTLIDKYLAGETTPEEERQLALEVSRPDAPEDWRIIAEMLGELTLDEALYDGPSPQPSPKWEGVYRGQQAERVIGLDQGAKRLNGQSPKRLSVKRIVWTAAACLVAVAITVPLVWSRQSTPDTVAYIYGQKVTDEDVVMELMASTMADVLDNGSDDVAKDLEDIFGN